MLLFIRIAKDNELTILRSSGISLGRILCPVMIFMLGISFLSFYLDSYLVPWSNYVSNELIRKVVLKDPQPDITERIFFKDTQNRFFYIDHVDLKSHLYSQVMIYETCGTYPRVILAKFAQWQQNQWVLRDGKIHRYNDQGYLSYDMAFQEMTIDVNYNPEQFFNKQKSSYEMSAKELQTQIKMFKQGGISTTRLAVDYHMKFSFAGASFIFGMIGLMLTSILVRSGKDWWKVITAVLLALLCVGFYFFLMAFFRSFGYGGMISPLWAAWTPNLIFGSIGGIVLIHEVIYR